MISTTNTVVGIDGKKYINSEPIKPRRSPLADSYWRAVHDLTKIVERLSRLHADDRFLANREALRSRHWRRISDIESLVMTIGTDLDGTSKCHACVQRILPNTDFSSSCGECSTVTGGGDES